MFVGENSLLQIFV